MQIFSRKIFKGYKNPDLGVIKCIDNFLNDNGAKIINDKFFVAGGVSISVKTYRIGKYDLKINFSTDSGVEISGSKKIIDILEKSINEYLNNIQVNLKDGQGGKW